MHLPIDKTENKILEIEKELREVIRQNKLGSKYLLIGHGGVTLFYFYAARYFNDPQIEKTAQDHLQKIFTTNLDYKRFYSFANGLSGIGWLLNHLVEEDFIDVDVNETLGNANTVLCEKMISLMKNKNYDFLHASLGIAYYLLTLDRIDLQTQTALEKIVHLLNEQVLVFEEDYYWPSFDLEKDTYDPLSCNMGLAHGHPSIISLLCLFYRKNICQEITAKLLEKSTEFLVNRVGNMGLTTSVFPHIYNLGSTANNSRLAWCYGDPGVALAIWNAGKTLQNSRFIDTALKVVMQNSERTNLRENSILDGGLCHGAAGVAQYFKRFHIETDQIKFLESAEYWTNALLSMDTYADGPAGYKEWTTNGRKDNYGFLQGISGIGLALLASISNDCQNWDSALLYSIK